MGLFDSLRLGAGSLNAHQQAIETAGHNIANVNTPGYSRQRAEFASRQAVGRVTAQGVEITQISRTVNIYLTNAIREQGSHLQSLETQSDLVGRVEEILSAFEDTDLSTALDGFFVAAQDLSDNPQDAGFREAFVSASDILSFRFNTIGQQLSDLESQANEGVDAIVDGINNLTGQIAQLNTEIIKVEEGGPSVNGRNANDLKDQRDELLRQLGEKIPVTVHEQPNSSVIVNVGGYNLIHDGVRKEVSVLDEVVNGSLVKTAIFKDNLTPLPTRGLGELGGLYEARDTLVGGTLDDLNSLAQKFMEEVNKIQTTGFGLAGYDSVNSWEAATATNVALNSAGFSRTVEHGNFTIQVREADGTVVPVNIQVDVDGLGSETTLNSLAQEINQKLSAAGYSGISASIDNNNFMKLESTTDATFSFTDDSSGVLHVLGWGAMFNGADAQSMSVNSQIASNINFIAAGESTGPQDNINALKFVTLRNQKVLNGNSETLEENNLAILGNAGTNAARIRGSLVNQEALVQSLENERQEKVGVNLDTEVIDLMRYQRGFEGAARYISVVDELLDRLIQLV